jgi:histidinol-phosphate phosphatase family protein
LSKLQIDKSWSLFLDRDGVINDKLENDYVKCWEEFKFKEGALEAITGLGQIFGRVIVVTNQRGVGLGIMTQGQLSEIHEKMLVEVSRVSGRIDQIYYCISTESKAECRKSNIGMGLKAKSDFPEIEFSKFVIVENSILDMEFGKKLGMKTVFIRNGCDKIEIDDFLQLESLFDFYQSQIIV